MSSEIQKFKKSPNSHAQPLQVLHILLGSFSLLPNNLSLGAIYYCCLLTFHWALLGRISLPLLSTILKIVEAWSEFPPCLRPLFSRPNQPPLWICICSRSWPHQGPFLCWTLSVLSLFLLHWVGLKLDPAYFISRSMNAEKRKIATSFNWVLAA